MAALTTYQHKHIASMTMTIIELTAKGYKCLVKDPKGRGAVRHGKIEFFDKQDVEGDKALFIKQA